MENLIILDDLEKVYNKTRDISKENQSFTSQENFAETLCFLLLSYQNEKTQIITKGMETIIWQKLSINKKQVLYRVLQELMTNMKKHSHATIVAITFQQERKLIVAYKDNGIGTSLKKGTGLTNTENRMASIKGSITFETTPNTGFKAIICI